ncbi:hypothetical protein SCHPADRAFT_346019 [Schizopora paradoxa]|uniref:G-protein coupled receptors family 1 profile domain-containing protein n=1 Tax=Schizopora paradoxa TaxID=27342 RepID=A0A0H2RPH6_9AGAM|nr:hypothetical protein SCHPADRAFT_346019 [Schizopora paradoxa]
MQAELVLYFVLLILGGHIGLPAAFTTIFIAPKQSKRHPTYISVLLSWIVFATSALFLLYTGEQTAFPAHQPAHALCLFQASMIYSRTVLVACTTLCLVIHLWLELRDYYAVRDSGLLFAMLLSFPWALFFITLIFSVTYGVLHPSSLSLDTFYCAFGANTVLYVVTCIAIAGLIGTIVIEAMILRILWRSNRQFWLSKRPTCHLCMRAFGFTIYTFVTLIMSLLITFRPDLSGPYVFVASLPLAAFLIFGTQREILCAWFGRCFPALNDPFVNVLGRHYKRRRRTEMFHIVVVGSPGDFSVGDSTTTPSVNSYLDKRSPRTPNTVEV